MFFSISVPQENGSSSQHMDDLFDILIQSGGKAPPPAISLASSHRLVGYVSEHQADTILKALVGTLL